MHALNIAAVGIKSIFREREALFWTFVGPVIFATFFGLLMRPQPAGTPSYAVVNRDSSDYVLRAIQAALKDDNVTLRPAASVPQDGWALEIPAGTEAALRANKGVKLVLHAGGAENSAERTLRFTLQRALTAVYLNANPADVPAGISREDLERRFAEQRVIEISRQDIGARRREVTSGFQRSLPSYMVMFLLLNQLAAGAGIAEERANGRLRRMFIAPVRKRDIVLGKLLSRVTMGWLQMAFMLLLGVLLFRIRWAEHTWVLVGFLTLYALAAASLGMLLGTLIREPDKARAAGIWTAVLLAPLGGLWWPLEVVGPTMRKIGYAVPTGWAMEAVNSMLAFDAGFREIAPFAAAMAAMTVVCLAVTIPRFRP